MTSNAKYIGLDVHKESISIAVRNFAGKVVMESVIETKASMILQFVDGLRGDLQVAFEEGHLTNVLLAGFGTNRLRCQRSDENRW